MGCVHGRPASSLPSPSPSAASERRRQKERRRHGEGAGVEAAEARDPAPEKEAAPPRKEQGGGGGGGDGEAPPPRRERRRAPKPDPRLGSFSSRARGEQVAAGWPAWLSAVAGEAINGWTPRRADTFEKIDKVLLPISTSFFRFLHLRITLKLGF